MLEEVIIAAGWHLLAVTKHAIPCRSGLGVPYAISALRTSRASRWSKRPACGQTGQLCSHERRRRVGFAANNPAAASSRTLRRPLWQYVRV